MAILDPIRNEIVLRVVYDGPPEAGKTTSVRALAASLGQEAITPEENERGRTQWFDWMEYVGGRFEGSQIRCQIVSVPGQAALAPRRKLLLDAADVIVFVGDTSPGRWEVTLDYLFALQRERGAPVSALPRPAEVVNSATDGPPVGIVFQANKRDVDGAVPITDLRDHLGDTRWHTGVVESVAADGTGIREAFVFAIRLALDRVRELHASGQLREGRPELLSADDLLSQMRTQLRGADPLVLPRVHTDRSAVAADLLREVLDAEAHRQAAIPNLIADTDSGPVSGKAAYTGPVPRTPDATVPSGAIWPPVEGRTILLEVAQLPLVPRRHSNGSWSAGFGTPWRLLSKRDAVYDSLDTGRMALVQWARLHAACTTVVSPHRCIVLAATDDGRWRLWQIVRTEPSLRELVERDSGLRDGARDPARLLDQLCRSAELLLDVHDRLAEAPCDLACNLDTIGACDASGMYIGLMPDAAATTARAPRPSPSALLADELGRVLEVDLAAHRSALGHALRVAPPPHEQVVLDSLRKLLA